MDAARPSANDADGMILALLSMIVALAQDEPISTALPVPLASTAAVTPVARPARAADFAGPLDNPRPPANWQRRSAGDLGFDTSPGAAQAEPPPPPTGDRKMRCRQTDNGFICGNGGENEKQAEDLLRSLLK